MSNAIDSSNRRVVLIQEHLPHYRERFFELLRESLAGDGISLQLIHGIHQEKRLISSQLGWATAVPLRRIGPFLWHQLGDLTAAADLIIVPQEIKYLRCLALQLRSRILGQRFAYWGHGRNFQATDKHATAEWIKRHLSLHVDWWFAYNDLSARIVCDLGFPAERITTVGNAIDTQGLIQRRNSLTESELSAIRKELKLRSSNIAVYTGGLYAHKRVDFLLKSAILIRGIIPDFELIVIGSGPDRALVAEAAREHPWIHDIGPKNDTEKVPYWALSKVLLMPGGVGLAVLDSFALGVPMITTDTRLHGPEIDYLENGVNGLLVPCGHSHETYAREVADLMNDLPRLAQLKAAAFASASCHTIESMAANFANGVLRALAVP